MKFRGLFFTILFVLSLSVMSCATCETCSFTNGFCDTCGTYEPAQVISSLHYSELNATHYGYYAIENAGQLYWFAQQVNAGNTSINACLVSDIKDNDVLSYSESRFWTPIGNKTLTYDGTFDGRGFEISGLYYSSTSSYAPSDTHVGLFGHIGSTATVKNLGVTGSSLSAYKYVGNIAGYSDSGSLITDCYSTSGTRANDGCAGGIVGHNAGTIEKCYNTGRIATTYDNAGGIAGYNTGLISNCYSICNISSRTYLGGIVGCNGGQVENCFFIGECYDYYDSTYDPNMGYSNGNGAKFTNCYYLYDEPWTTIGGKTNKTAEQFASGEVAYLLGDAFGQNLDNGKTPDTHPVFADGENKVFPALIGYTNRIIGGNTGGSGSGDLVIVTPSVSLTQSSVTANGIGGSCLLVVAKYNGDKFVSSSVSTISCDTTYELSSLLEYSKGDTIKAFILSNNSNPLCESKSIVIE